MKKNILNNHINIYKCTIKENVDNVLKYYNDYSILKYINIVEVECTRTITGHTKSVNSLLLLKDKRVASCSGDNTIRKYDPSNYYHCDEILRRHSKGVSSICELDDGTIVSCSYDGLIMINDYIISNSHDGLINKIIGLPNNRIASCSSNRAIKIWKINSDIPIQILEGHNASVNSLLYLKERHIMISGSTDETLRLWDVKKYQCKKVIKGVHCCWINSLYQIDKDRVIVGGIEAVYIVDIDKYVIEKIIQDTTFGFVQCFLKLRNTILFGCSGGLFLFNEINTKQYNIQNNDDITDLLMIDDNTFLSCSQDNTIKVWQYNGSKEYPLK